MTPQGNMNPKFNEVEIVPDEDLNTKLKFHVSGSNPKRFKTVIKTNEYKIFKTVKF